MINYTDSFFDLKLLKINDIKLHEDTETKRLRNIYSRIRRDKHLINPIIVAQYNKDLILIDGANRYSSLKDIGCKLVLAQIIDYKDGHTKLSKWNHLVYDMDDNVIKDYCDKYKLKYTFTSVKNGKKILHNNLNRVLVSDIKKNETMVITLSKDFGKMIDQLNDITHLYFKKYSFDRSEPEINFSDLKKFTRRKGTLIEFPKLKKEHIVKIAKSNKKIPAGITRHILRNRVLHVKYEIKKLLTEGNVKAKTKELEQMLLNKIDKNKVRQYTESVIVFDE
ncbi:MAG: hypothetical protein KDC73_11570 [Ignavibacteriae bacterium]|nr:hypothetical protein [Ignavibacteriota bacterium]MCB9243520.1 hypothetical protein [Ignavibacteriales bacterium]